MQKLQLLSTTGKPRTPSIINTSLPPVPRHSSTPKLERKDSGFSLNSNSLYGKFNSEDLEDDIYCKPPDFLLDNKHSYQDITPGNLVVDAYSKRNNASISPTGLHLQSNNDSNLDHSYQNKKKKQMKKHQQNMNTYGWITT